MLKNSPFPPLRARTLATGSLVLVCFALAACSASTPPGDPATDGGPARSLVAAWDEARVDQPVTPPEIPPRSEVRFDGGGLGASWQTLQDIENLQVEDGLLTGVSTGEAPMIQVDLEAPQGADDELWSVELRLRAGAGSRAGVHTLTVPGPPLGMVQGRAEDWPLSSPLESPGEMKTYSVVLDRVFLLEMPVAQGNIQRLVIRPTNVAGAEFAVESVRLVFRRERLATIRSGPGWHGLGEVFREALVSRTPEALSFPLTLPERPWLDLAVGSVEKQPPLFHVDVTADGETTTAASLTPEAQESWSHARVDLGRWAGREVELRLRAEAPEGAETDGQLAFWGAPTIRSSLADPETHERPSTVVLFLADTLRADHLEAWGHHRETAPTLSRLAGEGVRFADTVAQGTWTKVSVSSILTSLYPSTTGVADLNDRVSAHETTLAEVFREAGYATFATSSVPFSGQLTNLHQGVEVMHEYGAVPREEGDGFRSKSSRAWVDAYLSWIEQYPDVPTFALIHVMDPHSPFRPRSPFDTMWVSDEQRLAFEEQAETVRPFIESPLLRRFMAPTREQLDAAGVDAESFVEVEKGWYDGSIRGMDGEVTRLMDRLGELGLVGRTLFALVADHGEEFLEHGQHWHGQTVYGEVSQVPMALWGRGVPAGLVVEETVQTLDLMPTLLDLSGLSVPERAQGRSLVPLLQGADLRPLPAFTEYRGRQDERTSFAVVDGGWKLVWYPGEDAVELYDHGSDPLDQKNLSAEHPEKADALLVELRRWLTWAENQKLDDSELESEMSAEQLEQLRSLGYVE